MSLLFWVWICLASIPLYQRYAIASIIYVNPLTSSVSPDGSQSFPFPSLGTAWSYLGANANNTIYLASGTYDVPKTTLAASGTTVVTVAPWNSNDNVRLVPEERISGDLNVPYIHVLGQARIEFKSMSFTNNATATFSSMQSDSFGTLVFTTCVFDYVGQYNSSFHFTVQTNSTILFDSVNITSVMFELEGMGSSSIALRSTQMIGTNSWGRALFVLSGNALLNILGSQFMGVTDTMFSTIANPTVQINSSLFSQFQCNSTTYGFANIGGEGQVYVDDSIIRDVSLPCRGGHIGLFDRTQLFIRNSLLTNLTGKLVYAEGSGVMTVSSNSRLINLSISNVTDYEPQFIGNIYEDSVINFHDTLLDTLYGTWNVLVRGQLKFNNVTLIDNVCSSLVTFWITSFGSATVSMQQSKFYSRQVNSQVASCLILRSAEQVRLSVINSTIANYLCGASCIYVGGAASLTLNNSTFSQLVATDETYHIVTADSSRQHVFSNLNFTANTGPAYSVIGSYGAPVLVTNSVFVNNYMPSLRTYSGTLNTVSYSTFKDNHAIMSQKSLGSAVVNEGGITINSCNFINNAGADFGGAVYHTGDSLSVTNSTFEQNRATLDGGGIYLATAANLTDNQFKNNIASRGGGWFTLNSTALNIQISGLNYSNNSPDNYASDFNTFVLRNITPSSNVPLLVQPGGTIDAIIDIMGIDYFGQLHRFSETDMVTLSLAHIVTNPANSSSVSLNVTGDTTQALIHGIITYQNLKVYASNNTIFSSDYTNDTYKLQFSRLLMSGNPDPLHSIDVPLILKPCSSNMYLADSLTQGINHLACTPLSCNTGCLHGTCASFDNCTCQMGWEGLACDRQSGDVDTIVWRFSPVVFPYMSVGVRDALADQVQLLVSNLENGKGMVVYLRGFNALPQEIGVRAVAHTHEIRDLSQDTGAVELRFAVVNSTVNQFLQGDHLVSLNNNLLNLLAQPNTPVVRLTSRVFGYKWPPAIGAREAVIYSDVRTVPKKALSLNEPASAALVVIHLVGLTMAVVLWIFLVILPMGRSSSIVRISSRIWLSWYTLATVLMHIWMILVSLPPNDTICQTHMALGMTSVVLFRGVNFFKSLQLWLACNNPILIKPSSTLPKILVNEGETNKFKSSWLTSLRKTWISSGWVRDSMLIPLLLWFLLDFSVLLGWLIPNQVTAKIFWSVNDGSYWDCSVSEIVAVNSALVSFVLHGIITLMTLFLLFRARTANSPSQEPKVTLFVVVNMMVALSIVGAVVGVNTGFNIVTQYLVMSFPLGLALIVSTVGVLGYKSWLVIIDRNRTGPHGQSNISLNGIRTITAALKTGVGLPNATKENEDDMLDEELCALVQTDNLASSLVPIRLISGRSRWLKWIPIPWNVAFVEVAKEYRYMSTLVGNETARFFGLPCSMEVNQDTMVIELIFKSGTRMQIQARNHANMAEWESTIANANAL